MALKLGTKRAVLGRFEERGSLIDPRANLFGLEIGNVARRGLETADDRFQHVRRRQAGQEREGEPAPVLGDFQPVDPLDEFRAEVFDFPDRALLADQFRDDSLDEHGAGGSRETAGAS